MPYANHGDERLYFETRGEGPPLVLIRGLSRSMRWWTEDFLAPLAERYRLVLFDHRGIGRSYIEDARFSVADMADDLACVMDAADASRARVFGISLGGLVAQELALRHPDRIERLALGATFAGRRPHGPRFSMFGPLLFGAAMKNAAGQRMQMRVLTTPSYAREHGELADAWHAQLQEEPLNAKAVVRQMVAALHHDTTDRVHTIKAPTLLITGNADRLIPMKNSQDLAQRIPGSSLRVLDGAGHDFPAQRPSEAADALLSFFAGET